MPAHLRSAGRFASRASAAQLLLVLLLCSGALQAQTSSWNVRTESPALRSWLRAQPADGPPTEQAPRKAAGWATRLRGVQPLAAQAPATESPLAGWFTLNLQGDSAQIDAELRAAGFSAVEPNRRRRLHAFTQDTMTARQFYHPLIQTEKAWQTTRGDASVTIGFIDTGLDFDHPEFNGQVRINPAEDLNGNGRPDSTDLNGIDEDGNGYMDDVAGFDFVDQPALLGGGDDLGQDGDPSDDNGHGTGVAGVIGALPDNTLGGTGIAPGCRLLPLRAFSSSGVGEDDDIARAIVYAANNKVDVLNFSFGDVSASQMMQAAVQHADNKGVVMVSSAGNASGDNLHYPSGFPEVMSIAATDVNPESGREFLWPFSNFGTTTDLSAPGSRIPTPDLVNSNGVPQFRDFSGTSFAAPMVSAAAGLLLSIRPELTPEQLRGVLVSTAEDIEDPGWDHFTGAGRLDIARALAFPFGSTVEFLSPPNDAGSARDSIPLVANVLHPLYDSHRLYWRPSKSDSTAWVPLGEPDSSQVLADTLRWWDLRSLDPGEYTLRLSVRLQNGRQVEDRVRFLRDTTPPAVELRIAAPAWEDNRRRLMIVYRSDDRARSRLRFRALGDTTWHEVSQDKFTRNGRFVLGEEELASGPYELRVVATNGAGLTGVSLADTLNFQPAGIDFSGARRLDYALPNGAYLPRVADFNGDGAAQEFALTEYDDNFNPQQLAYYEFRPDSQDFKRAAAVETPERLLVKGFRDAGPGRRVLANFSDSFFEFRPDAGGWPTLIDRQVDSSGYFVSGYTDIEGDGEAEILARDAQTRYILQRSGNTYEIAHELPDTNENFFGVGKPRFRAADLDEDGAIEIWFGDFDGNLYAYEQQPDGSFSQVFFEPLPQQVAASDYLDIADLDGDGSPELFVATHSSGLRNADFENDPRYWTLRIFAGTGADNVFEEVWRDYLVGHFSDNLNALTLADLDGDPAAEVLLGAFPRVYLIDHHNGAYGMRWFFTGAATDHAVGDLNGNGIPEFALGQGDEAPFFELESAPGLGGLALEGQVTGNTSIQLSWNSLPGTATYTVLRQEVMGDTLGPSFGAFPPQGNTSFADNAAQGLEAGTTYAYVVLGEVGGDTTASDPLRLTLAPAIGLDSAALAGPSEVLLSFSGPVSDDPAQIRHIALDDSVTPSALVGAGEKELLLGFGDTLAPGEHHIRLDTNFLDANRRPLDAGRDTASFAVPPPPGEALYLTNWWKTSEHSAVLVFNRPLAAGQSPGPANFAVSPSGEVVDARIHDAAGRQVAIDLEGIRLGALGFAVSVRVSGLEGEGGAQIRRGEGDVAAFLDTADGLANIQVFPNPVRKNGFTEGARFGGLPREATITVISLNGTKLRTLRETDGDGGLAWDLRDFNGERLAPGTYMYVVSTPEGKQVEGSFSVLE